MKNSTFKLISFLVSFSLAVSVFYFGLPFWALLLLVPVNIYLQAYGAFQYSFRDSIEIGEIPGTGYEKRLAELNFNENQLNDLGFERFDRFYLPTTSDFVIYAYKHCEMPIVLCHYHLEERSAYDFMTDFENDFSLTTANMKYSAVGELRPANKLLQTFAELPVEMLYNKHLQSIKFLEQQGFVTADIPIYDFRTQFIKSFRESGKKLKGLLTPVKIMYLMYFGNKTRFSKTIQEQFLANQLLLPEGR